MSLGTLVFVGTYTRTDSKGIYPFHFDGESGQLLPAGPPVWVENPSFLAIHPKGHYLYAVSEIARRQGMPGGAITAFEIDSKGGSLKQINQQPTQSAALCHVTTDYSGKWIVAASYQEGTIVVLPIREDGGLGPVSDLVQHQGASIHPKRQTGPHAHSATFSPDNRFVYACDLGIDRIMIYRFDPDRGKLLPSDNPSVALHPGAGPRHFCFHPSGCFAYVINELDSTVTVFRFDSGSGTLEPLQTISTLPDGYQGANACADIHLSPDGRYLYGSNRGHNSIAIFQVDGETGQLELLGHQSTRGDHPRNFALDPSGKFLLVANQNTNNIVIFHIDPRSGRMAFTGQEIHVPLPVCIKFLT